MPTTKPAGRTERISARITPKTLRQIDDLRHFWGPVRALTPAEVAEEAIDRAWKAEKAAREKPETTP
jgi:hypothetical protein